MIQDRKTFKEMRVTISGLQIAIFGIMTTLKTESLYTDQKALAMAIMVAQGETAKRLKKNPTRKQMIVLCGAWVRFAKKANILVPEDQPALLDVLNAAIAEASWVEKFDREPQPSEVQP